jgi:predicted transcriptional regulator
MKNKDLMADLEKLSTEEIEASRAALTVWFKEVEDVRKEISATRRVLTARLESLNAKSISITAQHKQALNEYYAMGDILKLRK